MYSSASVTQVSQVTLLGILRFSTGLRSAMLSWGLFRPCQNKTQRQTLSCELSPRSTARFSPAHSEKEKRQADVWERYAVLCPLVGLTLLQCKLRTSLTAQFCVWFLLLCWCGAELWQPGRRWTCPTPALHLPYTCPTPALHLYCLPCGVKRSWLWYSRWKAAVTRLNVPFNEPAARWAVKLAS